MRLPHITLNRRTVVIACVAVFALLAIGLAIALSGDGGDEAASTTSTSKETTSTTKAKKVCPLLGLNVPEKVDLSRPALVVKIDNSQPKARPQYGLRQADVVYEERVEGSVTRFMAVFHCRDVGPVGPVRSGRTTDIGLYTPLNRPLYAWSGANDSFAAAIRSSKIVDVGHTPAADQYFREGSRPAPHNLLIRGVAEMIAAHAPAGSKPPPALFKYRESEKSTVGRPIRGVHIVFGGGPGSAPVDYTWDGEGWARSQAGTPHVDVVGRRIAPDNVIIQFTNYVSSGVNDQFGNPIPEAQVGGEGDAWVLTGGRLIEARWRKTSFDRPTTYATKSGKPILLTPGVTWVALPPPGSTTVS